MGGAHAPPLFRLAPLDLLLRIGDPVKLFEFSGVIGTSSKARGKSQERAPNFVTLGAGTKVPALFFSED